MSSEFAAMEPETAYEPVRRRDGWLAPAMMPFAHDMNYGRALNEAMELLPEGAWACFLDHDAVFTTRQWRSQIEESIAVRPEAGLFTAVANRIGPHWQRAGDYNSHDMAKHRKTGAERAVKNRTLLDVTDTKGIGGVLMVTSKQAWRSVGGFADGLNCIDHVYHFAQRAAGRRVYVMEHVFLQHWRRANNDAPPEDAPRAENCPCRGVEIQPMLRVRLP